MHRLVLSLAVVLSATGAVSAAAADGEAGKAKATTLCAACHGANGVSVADHIPNLAGQRAAYLVGQLQALKDGSRKNDVMNAIATQLSKDDIRAVAAYFAALPGASGSAKSAFLPNVVKTNVTFPANYKADFTLYHTINDADSKSVSMHYASSKAVAASKAGKPLPDGSVIVVEAHAAKLDADKKPVTGADGFFVPDRLRSYTVMARDKGWGAEIPEALRNEDWNYGLFTADRQLRTGINQAECLACHKPIDKLSYVFTQKKIAEVRP